MYMDVDREINSPGQQRCVLRRRLSHRGHPPTAGTHPPTDTHTWIDVFSQLAWPHRRRGLASDGVRYAGARSSVGRRFRSATKLKLEWYGGVFLLLQQRSKHPREMVITLKASISLCTHKHTHTHIYIHTHTYR